MNIRVKHVTKQYGAVTAIQDLGFELNSGEIVGLIGANGAGKTTTLAILTGYITQTSGSVFYNGQTLEKHDTAILQALGYLPEKVPVYPELTVDQQLKYCAGLKQRSKGQSLTQEVNRVIELLELSDHRYRLVSHLSKGFRQRLGLAQALLWDPDFLVLDEPMSGLDPKQVAHMRTLIQDLGQEKTVLLSSHDLSQVQQICTRVCILSQGKLIAQGSPGELEKQLGKTRSLEITLRCTVTDLEKLKNSLSEAVVQFLEPQNSDQDATTLRIQSSQDLRPVLNEYCRKNSIDILGMSAVQTSLEQLFMEITSESSQHE